MRSITGLHLLSYGGIFGLLVGITVGMTAGLLIQPVIILQPVVVHPVVIHRYELCFNANITITVRQPEPDPAFIAARAMSPVGPMPECMLWATIPPIDYSLSRPRTSSIDAEPYGPEPSRMVAPDPPRYCIALWPYGLCYWPPATSRCHPQQ